jgi:hypothetical protein
MDFYGGVAQVDEVFEGNNRIEAIPKNFEFNS